MIASVSSVKDLRTALLKWREAGDTVAFVPTMGALHKGHMALIETAKKIASRTLVSIFVNPMQFGPQEDLSRYPRPLEDDQKKLQEAGCDLLYTPSVASIYPDGFATAIDPGPLSRILEGAIRPGHFLGVATVVTKLLLQAMPDAALFGEKDFQQLLIIRQVTRDLDIPVHIIGVPIVRDTDGLAFSSRNLYLSTEERKKAVLLPETLSQIVKELRVGKSPDALLKDGNDKLLKAGFVVDYLELLSKETLKPQRDLEQPMRLLAAVRLGTTRLLDNMDVDS